MITLLDETKPKARKQHRCQYCYRPIDPGTRYLNQRCSGDGTIWTFKCHTDCHRAYWSWVDHGDDGYYELTDLTEGHLPPCWHAYNHDIYLNAWPWTIRFIGPPAPCTCGKDNPASEETA